MPESISDFLQKRGSIGVLSLLQSGGGQRFTDLDEKLNISSATLTTRIGEARDLGLVTPEMDESDYSVGNQYRITDRGQAVTREMDRLGIVHAKLTILDLQKQIDEELPNLLDWLKEQREELARLEDQHPYRDAFGQDLTNMTADEEKRENVEEFLEKE